MNRNQLIRVLAWTLEGQRDDLPPTTKERQLSKTRMREALSGRHPFDRGETAALLHSPGARDRLRFMIEARRAEQLFEWKQLGISTRLERRAAASERTEAVTVRNEDFSLTVLPLDDEARTWLLHLAIAPQHAAELVGRPLCVTDESGAIWLKGIPDNDGELSGSWTLDGSPPERLAKSHLIISPA